MTQTTPSTSSVRIFPPHRRHYAGWLIVLVGLVVTTLTPRLSSGTWHEIGRSAAEGKWSPYNIFLTLGILALLYVAYARKSKNDFWRVTLVMLVETALYGLIKTVTWFGFHLFPRPSHGDGGFPSGHTAAVCALAYLLTERWPKGAPLWYAIAAFVGWARWASGAHYPYQVIGGALLGLIVAVTLSHRFDRLQTAAAHNPQAAITP